MNKSRFWLPPAREAKRNADLLRDWHRGLSYHQLSYKFDLPEHLIKFIVKLEVKKHPAGPNDFSTPIP